MNLADFDVSKDTSQDVILACREFVSVDALTQG
jgi:hypothetical protein